MPGPPAPGRSETRQQRVDGRARRRVRAAGAAVLAPALRLTSDSTRSPTTLIAHRKSSAMPPAAVPGPSPASCRGCATDGGSNDHPRPDPLSTRTPGHAAPTPSPAFAGADRRASLRCPKRRPPRLRCQSIQTRQRIERQEVEADRRASAEPGQRESWTTPTARRVARAWRAQLAARPSAAPPCPSTPDQHREATAAAGGAAVTSWRPARRHKARARQRLARARRHRPGCQARPLPTPAAPMKASVSSANGHMRPRTSLAAGRRGRRRRVETRCFEHRRRRRPVRARLSLTR